MNKSQRFTLALRDDKDLARDFVEAIIKSDKEQVDFFLRSKRATALLHRTPPIHIAIYEISLTSLQCILRHGVGKNSPNWVDERGMTPIDHVFIMAYRLYSHCGNKKIRFAAFLDMLLYYGTIPPPNLLAQIIQMRGYPDRNRRDAMTTALRYKNVEIAPGNQIFHWVLRYCPSYTFFKLMAHPNALPISWNGMTSKESVAYSRARDYIRWYEIAIYMLLARGGDGFGLVKTYLKLPLELIKMCLQALNGVGYFFYPTE
jgi:hypothetical protein